MFHRTPARVTRKRGAAAVFTAVALLAIVAFVALAIDVSQITATRNELQRSADAAAMAAAAEYFSDAGIAQRLDQLDLMTGMRARQFSALNPNRGRTLHLTDADVEIGRHDFEHPSGALSMANRFNAVEVTARRTTDSPNGALPLAFAPVLGNDVANVKTTARAVADDRFAGWRVEEGGYPNLVPFTIREDLYHGMVESGNDDYGYSSESVNTSSDGINEVVLFPWKSSGGGSDGTIETDGSGNFGIVDIQSFTTGEIEDQVESGIGPEELIDAIGSPELVYHDDSGPVTHDIPGTPGMKTSITDVLESRIGDVIGFFLHDDVTGDGSNSEYRNVGIRFGRIMDVELHGAIDQRRLVIQPVSVQSSYVILSDAAPSTNGQVGRVVLVR